jgi:gliding motility-associated-like protein
MQNLSFPISFIRPKKQKGLKAEAAACFLTRKLVLAFVLVFFTVCSAWAQAPGWTFLKGHDQLPYYGTYGTQGVAAAGNTPGARLQAVTWESNGLLYLFGGTGYDASGSNGKLNDLWAYDPGTSNWTWLKGSSTVNQSGTYGTKGVADANNTPGARYSAVTWESEGKLYLFGGYGSGQGWLNDLWAYDPATKNWTWLKGSSTVNQSGTYGAKGVAAAGNTPGGRDGAVTWESEGKLYLFGGYGSGSGWLNDLWAYDLATSEWTWLKGSSNLNQYGTYGTQGTAAGSNIPGGREDAVTWESGGLLYLFGGSGYAASTIGRINDLWAYDPASNNWTWLEGSSAVNQSGTYGTQGVAAVGNTPGARQMAVTWESGGLLYLFGGDGYAASSSGNLNDLWAYDPATSEWTWLKGSSTVNQFGTYGTKGVAAADNIPGGRKFAVTWESEGRLYLFGGYGYGVNGDLGYRGDLWVTRIPNAAPTNITLSATDIDENVAANSAVGSFTTTDEDDNQHAYALVSGAGSTDNALFEILGNQLYLKSNKSLSGRTSFTIRVSSTDPYGNTIAQDFTLRKAAAAGLKIVNTFSPNGDGYNDKWVIPDLRFYNDVQVDIFDRNGSPLFRSTDPEMGWDGKAPNGLELQGPVLYVVQVKDINLVKNGVLTILRK